MLGCERLMLIESIESNYEDQAAEYYYFWRGKRANFLNLNFFWQRVHDKKRTMP